MKLPLIPSSRWSLDRAPEGVADALLQLCGEADAAALTEDAGLPGLAAALEPEVVPVVAGVPDHELDGARPSAWPRAGSSSRPRSRGPSGRWCALCATAARDDGRDERGDQAEQDELHLFSPRMVVVGGGLALAAVRAGAVLVVVVVVAVVAVVVRAASSPSRSSSPRSSSAAPPVQRGSFACSASSHGPEMSHAVVGRRRRRRCRCRRRSADAGAARVVPVLGLVARPRDVVDVVGGRAGRSCPSSSCRVVVSPVLVAPGSDTVRAGSESTLVAAA